MPVTLSDICVALINGKPSEFSTHRHDIRYFNTSQVVEMRLFGCFGARRAPGSILFLPFPSL